MSYPEGMDDWKEIQDLRGRYSEETDEFIIPSVVFGRVICNSHARGFRKGGTVGFVLGILAAIITILIIEYTTGGPIS